MESQSVSYLIAQAADEQWEELDLSGMALSELPPEIGNLVSLKRLILGKWDQKKSKAPRNYLKVLPQELIQLQQLEELNLSYNQNNTLPESIGQLINLTSLDLQNNELNTLPESIGQLINLTSLDLQGNKLSALPESISQLTNLTSLDLRSNKLNALPESISQLTNLTSLELLGNQLKALPKWIGQLTKLTSLNLSNNQLNVLPEWIYQLTKLTSLNLSNNQLNVLPEWIGQLTKLTSLNLSNNQLNALPEWIGQLTKLTSLNLSNNQLNALPEWIDQLTKLTSLKLSNNQLKALPEWIGQLTKLTVLNLSNNQLNTLPLSISQLTKLTVLNLSNNQLNTLPLSISQLTKLTVLNLSNNQLNTLPEWIGQLTKLTVLNLSNNQLNTLPLSISQLINLTSLNLSNNQLNTLPKWIGELTNLTSLNLSNNQLNTLPLSISQLINLKRLVLRENPIMNIPPEIIRKGWGLNDWEAGDPQSIFSYLQSTAKRPLNELKVLLIGEGDVGKTSLLKSLLGKPFDEQELKTPGINIEQLPFSIRNENIRLNLWDFGGQRVMHNSHQFFLTKRSLYLLVLDNRKNEQQNRVEYWLKLIETYGGDSPVIIIGNCADEHPLDLKQRALQKKYPQIKKFIATSCKTGQGLTELRQAITDQIDQIPHVRDLLPEAWFDIKIQLEEMQATTDFISYEKYQDLCQKIDINNPQDQKTLIGFLHDLGIILNFQDDQRLQDTNVLNPEWVTSGVYDILNNHDLMVKKKGILTIPDLPNILKQIDRYPEIKRPFLMGLLEKFELCFKMDGYSPRRYLISDLLPIDEPDIDIYESAPLHFQYHYDLLPSSIISRFIVRNHTMVYKTMLWRSGAVLTQDLSKALVRADEEDTFITIKVQGNRSNALLSTIRADFQKIHNTIPNLAVREFLVIREFHDGQFTEREVPVDYNYLCNLDRQGITETPLPNLKDNYNIRDILEGVESYNQRQKDLDDRLNKGYIGRDGKRLVVIPKKKKPSLVKVSAIMLVILAAVSAIFVVIAHYIPGAQLILIIPAILLGFPIVIIPALRITGIITDETFNKSLEGFFHALPILRGKDPDAAKEPTDKQLPESPDD
jgi:internalin A